MKRCKACGEMKPLSEYHKHKAGKGGIDATCKPCRRRNTNKWRKENPEKLRLIKRRYKLKKHYGITIEDYHSMLSRQGGRCKICGARLSETTAEIAVDHDHGNGNVRGILCNNCNSGLGFFKDRASLLKKAIVYLKKCSPSRGDKTENAAGRQRGEQLSILDL